MDLIDRGINQEKRKRKNVQSMSDISRHLFSREISADENARESRYLSDTRSVRENEWMNKWQVCSINNLLFLDSSGEDTLDVARDVSVVSETEREREREWLSRIAHPNFFHCAQLSIRSNPFHLLCESSLIKKGVLSLSARQITFFCWSKPI